MFKDHYIRLDSCNFYSAPRTPIRPVMVKPACEYVEIITDGVVYFGEGDNKREYRRGAIFWHQSGEETVYRTSVDAPYRCLVCRFETDGGERPVSRIGNWGNAPALDAFTEDMLFLAASGSLQDEAALWYCLGTLMRQMNSFNTRQLPSALQRACRLLESDPTANPDINLIAARANLSPSRLFALFNEYLHTSPHQYLLERKITLAKELLITRPGMPIKYVAESCGFNTLEIFYRRFRQRTGMTPADYRNENAG